MKFLPIFTLFLCSALAQGAPLVGFASLEPANQYQIVNVKGSKIFSATADTIRRVELRDGFAVVQTSTNNVSLIREDGKVIVDSFFGSEFEISKKLFSVFNKDGVGAVFTLSGTKLYPALDESQTRPVQNIWIANDRFAVLDKITKVLSVYSLEGKEIFRGNDSSRVLFSDGFLVAVSSLGTLSLYDAQSKILATTSGVSQIQISDEFAGFVESTGNLRLFSRQAGEFPILSSVSNFSLTDTFAMVKDSFGLTVYGKDKMNLENPSSVKNVSFSHALFATVINTGALLIKNEETGDSFAVNQADSYAMSDDLLVVKNGMGQFTIYSLQKETFGNAVDSILDQTVANFQVGKGIVSFETTLASGASNSAKVFYISKVNGGISKSVLVDESPVNRVNLSVNREEWNWQ